MNNELLLSKIKKNAKVFYGISNDYFFLQLCTFYNEIVFDVKTPIRVIPSSKKAIDEAFERIMSIFLKEDGVDLSKSIICHYDGMKVIDSGKETFQICDALKIIHPGFNEYLLKSLRGN